MSRKATLISTENVEAVIKKNRHVRCFKNLELLLVSSRLMINLENCKWILQRFNYYKITWAFIN